VFTIHFSIQILYAFVLFLGENVDDPFSFDPDANYSSLSDVEKLDKMIQSDQCFLRCVIHCVSKKWAFFLFLS